MNRKSDAYRGVLFAAIAALLWGVLAIALKVSLNHLTPADITWFRFFMAFALLAAYYLLKKPARLTILRHPPLLLVIASLCLSLNYFGFIKGLHYTTPVIAQIFIQLGPVLLAVSGFVFFREKAGIRHLIGLTIVAAGLVVFYREQLQGLQTANPQWQQGILWIVMAAVTWAAYSVLIKILVSQYPPMQLNLVVFGLPVLIYLPFIRFSHFFQQSLVDWLILLFLGLNTLFAYGLLTMAIRYIEANKVSVIIILNPILTFLIMGILGYTGARWIAPEHITWTGALGAAAVLSGAVLTILRGKGRLRKQVG